MYNSTVFLSTYWDDLSFTGDSIESMKGFKVIDVEYIYLSYMKYFLCCFIAKFHSLHNNSIYFTEIFNLLAKMSK